MKKTYYLFNPGRLQRRDNTLKFTPYDEEGNEQKPRYLPVENVGELYCFGNLDANSALYNFLGQQQVPLHFFDYHENYTGTFMPRESLISGKMLISQVKVQQNRQKRITLAQRILDGAGYNMLKNLRYYNSRGKDLEPIIDCIDKLTGKVGYTTSIEELMGIEGNIRKNYYEAFELIINDYSMSGRSYRPPKNEVNAFLNTGLKDYLDEYQIKNVVLCGMQTHMCLEAATRAVHDLGFNCTVAGDACATQDITYNNVTTSAEQVHSSTLATLRNYGKVISTEEYLEGK